MKLRHRIIVLILALSMLVTGSGVVSFAETMGEDSGSFVVSGETSAKGAQAADAADNAENGAAEKAAKEQASSDNASGSSAKKEQVSDQPAERSAGDTDTTSEKAGAADKGSGAADKAGSAADKGSGAADKERNSADEGSGAADKAGSAADEAADTDDAADTAADGFDNSEVVKTATDNKTYRITAKYGFEAGIPAGAELTVTEIDADSTVYDAYIDGAAERIGQKPKDISSARAFDISFTDPETGIRYQPDSSVSISIRYLDEKFSKGSEVSVIHFPDTDAEETDTEQISAARTEVLNSEASGRTVDFDASGFSVYVIIEHEGGNVVTPRVEFHFITPKETASSVTTGGVVYYESTPYEFKNKANNKQTSMIVHDGDVLESIEAPNGTQSGQFYGWYTVDLDSTSADSIRYSWPDDTCRVELGSAASVTMEQSGSSVASITWTISGVTRTETTDIDADGCAHVYLAPIYENYHFANFHLGARGESTASSIMTRKLIVLGSSNQTDVLISDIQAPSSDPLHKMFTGWEHNTGTETDPVWTLEQTVDDDGNTINTSIAAGPEDIDLYPYFVGVRWINYNVGASHNGASYKAPKFMHTSDLNTGANADDNALSNIGTADRTGYGFGGWYVNACMKDSVIMNLDGPYTDPDTGKTWTQAIKLANADGSVVAGPAIRGYANESGELVYSETSGYDLAFKTENGKLYVYTPLNELTVYANWVSQAVNFTIVYWTENADNNNYVANVVRTVSTEDLSSATGRDFSAGSTVQLSDLSSYTTLAQLSGSGAVSADDAKFFEINTAKSDSSAVIAGDSSTMFNVYYSRMVFTLVFHIGRDGYVSTGGSQRQGNPNNDRNWIEYFFKDNKVTSVIGREGKGASTQLNYSFTYGGRTYSSAYETTQQNVKADYLPADSENVYMIKAKYGAYIGDKWPAIGNSNFTFSNTTSGKIPYIWSANYYSRYCYNTNQISQGNEGNPDIVGLYNYMSDELCTDRDGNILPNRVHHLTSYFGNAVRTDVNLNKTYHFLVEDIDGVTPAGAATVSGSSYTGTNYPRMKQAQNAGADASVISGKNYYEIMTQPVKTERDADVEVAWKLDGYDYVYSCYTPNNKRNATDLYFFYTPKQYTLTFSKDTASDFTEDKVDTYYYGESLSGARKYDDPSKDNYQFIDWYTNSAGAGDPFDFAGSTMPSSNIVLYPVFEISKYRIMVDPNGGIMDHINYGTYASALNGTGLENNTGYNASFATYFNNTAEETISVNQEMQRPYVEITDAEAATMAEGTVYRYVNMQFDEQYGSYAADARNAVYILDSEESIAAYYDYYCQVIEDTGDGTALPRSLWESVYVSASKYRELHPGEHYKLLGWYEVYEDGSEASSPFNFSQPTEHATRLRAHWQLDGGYSVQYTTDYYASGGDHITSDMEGWVDPSGGKKYADGAVTMAMQEPAAVSVNGEESDEYQFRGWQIVKVDMIAGKPHYTALEPGVYYTAGQAFTVQARYADADMVIHMQAVYEKRENAYRRPDVISLTLDASEDAAHLADPSVGGTGSIDTGNGTWPAWNYTGHYWSDDTHIYFGDTQSNTAVHLYKYATELTESEETGETLSPAGVNFFEHSAGYKLIGFDLDEKDTDFVPTYAADGVVAVTPGEQHTLYAVWEPMVYLTVVNDTDVGPVTFDLSGTGQSVYIVNKADGEFSRTAIDTRESITLAEGETIRLVIPYGEGETFTMSGTNELGVGYLLTAKSELGTTHPEVRTLTGTYSRVPNTEDFSFSDSLVADPEGVVITFKAERAPHTLLLKDNYNGDGTGGGTKEASFSETPDGTVYYQEETVTSYTLPSTSTRIGYELLGWDEDPQATVPEYKSGAWDISNLTQFFTSSGSTTADIELKTLYAIWKVNAESSTVYVWKDVPEPGDRSKDFAFTVQFGGGFEFIASESYTSWFQTRYRWKATPSTGTIAANTAQGNTAVLSRSFTLRHNQYLKIVTVKDEANGNDGARPSLTMTVSKWQRNSDGTEDTRLDADDQAAGIQSEVTLSWYWANTIKIGDPTGANQYKDFNFKNLALSVTEDDYSSQYDLGIDVAAETTQSKLTPDVSARKVGWNDTFAGGTVIFTNTRKTADVKITKTLLPDTLDPENFAFTASVEDGETYVLDPDTRTIRSGTGEWIIPGIPTGAKLTITETVDSDRYETAAAAETDASHTAVTDLDNTDNIFKFEVTEDTTVSFTNELKKQKIRLVVTDDEDPANYLDSANFTFPGVFEGTKYSAANTGLVWEGEVFVGDYTLTETSMPDHAGVRYIKLQSPAAISIRGGEGGDKVTAAVGNVKDRVDVTYDSAADTYIITVINPRMMRVTVKKTVVKEPEDDTFDSFLFGITLTDAAGAPVQLSNVYGANGTDAQGHLEFTLVDNQTALLYVPKLSNITITETEDAAYKTEYQIGADAEHLDAPVEGRSVTLRYVTEDKYTLFTNTLQDKPVAPTAVGQKYLPYIFILIAGCALVALAARSRRRGEEDKDRVE